MTPKEQLKEIIQNGNHYSVARMNKYTWETELVKFYLVDENLINRIIEDYDSFGKVERNSSDGSDSM